MNKQEIQDITREYFKSIGFQTLKKSKFYFDSDKIKVEVNMFHSNFDELYIVEYNFRIKSLHPEITNPNDYKVWDLVVGRLTYDRNRGCPIEYLKWEKEQYLKVLNELVPKQIIPIMQYDLKYIKKLVKNCKSVDAYIYIIDCNKERILSLKE